MAEPTIVNETGFEFSPLVLADEEAVPLLVPLIKGTYAIERERLRLADRQAPIETAGRYWGDPAESSYKYEPETAFVKLATDVVLIGHARAPEAGAVSVDVGVKVGPVQKILRVFGDRFWVKTGGTIIATKPRPFESIPLIYERAFGGWDRAHKDAARWTCDRRNPVGRGFGDPLRYVEEGKVPMPNIEDPNHLIKRYGDRPSPAGCGFMSPHWEERARFAGSYDDTWDKERKPLLPVDFDRRFFNSASPGLRAPGYLNGGEEVIIVNASPLPRLRFSLPGLAAPLCKISLRGGNAHFVQTNLDTVIINTDEMLVFLLWRAHIRLPRGPHDLTAIEVTLPKQTQAATA